MRAIVLAVVIALVPATVLAAKRMLDSPAASPSHSSTDLPIPPVTPTRTTPSTAPGGSPTVTPAAPQSSIDALPKVRPDAPRRLVAGTVLDVGFDNSVSTITTASTAEVARLGTRGSPGSPGTDTVYVIGKVEAGGDSAFAGLPRVHVGASVSIRTDSGTMTYTVRAVSRKPASGLVQDPVFTEHRPGRLVLVGVQYDASGARLADLLVVTAELTGARTG